MMSTAARARSDEAATRLHPSAWLAAPTLALLLGQAAAPWAIAPQALLALLLPLIFGFSPRWRQWSLLILIGGAGFTVGYARHRELLFPEFPAYHLRSFTSNNERIYLEGVLQSEPEKLTNRTRFQLSAERIWHPTGAQEVTGNLLFIVRAVRRDWRYGDRLRFWIRPVAPRDAGNPGGFDYATYLAQRGIYVTGFVEDDREFELVSRNPNRAREFVENLRRQIRRYIEHNFSPDAAALMNALVVGDMGGITREMRSAYTDAGVNHVLSISGLHVAMLGLVVFTLIRFGAGLSPYLLLRVNVLKLATFFSFLAVIFYTALAGAMVPTVRSAIMIGVYELAVLMNREEEVFASLTLAALLIALVWPAVIADISFQLSFLAVLFIVWGMRKINEWFSQKKTDELPIERSWFRAKLRQLGTHLAVPLFATLGTGPLIAHYFGHLSLAGFVANPIIVPLVGFVVVPLGLVIGFLSLAAPELGSGLVWLAEKLAALTTWLVQQLAHLPLANLGVPSPSGLEVVLLYALLIACLALKRKVHLAAALGVAVVSLGVTGAYWWAERLQRSELRITHLNVGQGDAAVVELPGSKVLLIDAGGAATSAFDTGEAIVAPFLRSRKIRRVDYLVVTHARIDHYGGMRTIVNEFAPREFWSGSAKGQTSRFDDLEDALAKAAVTRVALHDGEPCRALDQVNICVLYPPRDSEAPAVIRLKYGNLTYLFTSDIDLHDQALLLQRPENMRSTVITVPRHGNAAASPPEFIRMVSPKLAILSAGARSRDEAGRQVILERYQTAGVEVLRTDEDGAVIVETDGRILRYHGFKSGKRGEMQL
ncbi:MAG TPA: DNA internalization-related competence protein ComEC/Rec2 [Candidatus Binatia bacterium]